MNNEALDALKELLAAGAAFRDTQARFNDVGNRVRAQLDDARHRLFVAEQVARDVLDAARVATEA